MQKLNLPSYQPKLRQHPEHTEIFDISRKKYVKLTPEEWVRQSFINYLITEKGYPASLIVVEIALKYNKLTKKADIIVYDNTLKPKVIVECKAPEIKLTQDVFDQIARYNFVTKVDYLIVTNGMEHYCCKMDYFDNTYKFLEAIPDYKELGIRN
jgi:hypothetical protein